MTIKEIAALAGVSISTVSKIVNNKSNSINAETRDRVLKIVKEYNYVPYGDYKQKISSKSFIIGILVKSSVGMASIIRGITNTASNHGYCVLILDSQNSMESEKKHITSLIHNHVDGVIWQTISPESLNQKHQFSDNNTPVCLISESADANSFHIDYKKMGYDMTQELVSHHHKRIVCLSKPDCHKSECVIEGYKKCLFDNNIPFSQDMIIETEETTNMHSYFLNNITGAISSHYSSAISFFELAQIVHRSIPEDISIITLKSEDTSDISYPKISSILIPYYSFGAYICNNVIQLCEGNRVHDSLTYSTYVKPKSSVSIMEPFTSRPKNIVVVGSINMDVTLNVSSFPKTGETTTIVSSSVSPGGKGNNQAIGVARLGVEVSLIGKTGNDYDASIIYNTLKDENIKSSGVTLTSHASTGKAYIYVQKDAESSISILAGANSLLSPNDIKEQEYLFTRCGYCLVSTEIPINTVIAAMQIASMYGATNIVKPAMQSELPDTIYQLSGIFIPNRQEAAVLCPDEKDIESQADYFMSKGASIVIITLGHNGCYLKTSSMSKHFPAADFTTIDSTGGADAFISALASYMSIGYSLEKAVSIATYAAGFCISRQGVAPVLIDKNSLENYIKNKNPQLLLL